MLTVVNTVVLSLYALQVFNDHKPCTTRSGKNITIGFAYLYKVGFVLQIIDSCSSLIGLFVKALTYVHQSENCGPLTFQYKLGHFVATVMGWVCVAALLALTLFQL